MDFNNKAEIEPKNYPNIFLVTINIVIHNWIRQKNQNTDKKFSLASRFSISILCIWIRD